MEAFRELVKEGAKMDILKISSVNKSYIFFNDNTRMITKINILIDILPLIQNKVNFYNNMYEELQELYNNKHNILKNMHCPAESECQGIIGVDNYIKRKNYIKYADEIAGIYTTVEYAFVCYNHFLKILNEIKKSIN